MEAPADLKNNIPKDHIAATIKEKNVVDINILKSELDSTSTSDFAAKMMEGTPTVVFTIE
ncbi:MAG: hypothetical protein KJO39_00980 [Bacteroidia bacterium]|nr:hypothetical protein [Bacteroidia bacterium]NNF29765.1 hypothetical protein [Flavobacteriaceae bacterium]NNJ81328.1 hypothetical protein [Flavobacteriaceae bacterium]